MTNDESKRSEPYSSLVTRHSSLVTRHSSFVTCHSSLVIRHSSFVTCHSSLVIRHSVVVAEGGLKRKGVLESDQFPSDPVQIASVFRIGKKSHDCMKADELEKFRL